MKHVKVINHKHSIFRGELDKMKGSFSKVGFPEDGTPDNGKKKKNRESLQTMTEVAQIAAVQEFGAPSKNIPERSFVRSSFDENLPKLLKMRDREYLKIINQKSTVERSLGLMGEFGVNKMRQKIRDTYSPKNADSTIARKESSHPLIDTAQMLQSIQHAETIS
jgi:hypothetical protein